MAIEKTKYFRYESDINRDDEYTDWGTITFLTELNNNNRVIRQIEFYQNGNLLKYDENHITDKYGMLPDQKLEIGNESIKISAEEFEECWKKSKAINRPEPSK